jgi:hypothetical protein
MRNGKTRNSEERETNSGVHYFTSLTTSNLLMQQNFRDEAILHTQTGSEESRRRLFSSTTLCFNKAISSALRHRTYCSQQRHM